jgi:hypothetical protein
MKTTNGQEFKIASQLDAYVVGFCLGNGATWIDKTGRRKPILSVSTTDEDIGQLLSAYFGTNNPFIKYPRLSTHKILYVVQKCSDIVWSFIKIGVVKGREGFNPDNVCLPVEFEKGFVLGFLDACGCIYYNDNLNLNRTLMFVKFTKTPELLEYIADLIEKNLGINKPTICHNGLRNGCRRAKQMVYYSRKASDILSWIYADTELGCQRKRAKAMQVMSFCGVN